MTICGTKALKALLDKNDDDNIKQNVYFLEKIS